MGFMRTHPSFSRERRNMLVSDLYANTKSIMFEKSSSTIYDAYVIGNVNLLISELFEENNMCRYFKGEKALTSVPFVSAMSDELTYEDEYTKEVMPLGLAAKFFVDDDLNKFNIFNTEYNNARVRNQKMVSIDEIEEIEEED